MLKSKDTRDTILLIFMTLIIVVFLVYIFVPKKDKPQKKDIPSIEHPIIKNSPPPEKIKIPEESVPAEKSILEAFNQKIENELSTIAAGIFASPQPFKAFDTENLKKILLEPGSELLEKLCKFSFFDLDDILHISFPESFNNSLKFNLFVSLFLMKIQEEMVDKAFESLPKVELKKLVNFDIYNLIDNEIESEYQLIPLLFYFKHLIRQLNIYPAEDNTLFFKNGCRELRDLTTGKYLVKILDLLGFSKQKENFYIEWVEEDGIFSDDKDIYKNVSLNVYHFLKQKYLVFPDPENAANNIWIKDLCHSDRGDIELKYLDLKNQDPSRQLEVRQIIYTPMNHRFIALLESLPQKEMENKDILGRLVMKRMEEYHKSYLTIDFNLKETEYKLWVEDLKKFGKQLKKNLKGLI